MDAPVAYMAVDTSIAPLLIFEPYSKQLLPSRPSLDKACGNCAFEKFRSEVTNPEQASEELSVKYTDVDGVSLWAAASRQIASRAPPFILSL